jgi:hypothetical protein
MGKKSVCLVLFGAVILASVLPVAAQSEPTALPDIYSAALNLPSTPPPQQFAIGFGDTVSDGVPAPGAGNLEESGAVDVYTFSATAGQSAIFDVLAGSASLFRRRLEAPDGTVLMDGLYFDGQVSLALTGPYTLTVSGSNATSTGTYSFRLLEVPAPQQFAIAFGDTVSDGVPTPGAGNLEAPGAVDIYTFDAVTGQEAIFDILSGSNVQIGWRLLTPNNQILFDTIIGDRQLILNQTGTYTLTVRGNGPDRFGLYSFRLLEAPAAPQQFVIGFGDTVSDGMPAPGAGNLEAPGAVDLYTFDAVAGQEAIFDWLSGSNTLIGWRLEAPDSAVLFDSVLQDWQLVLPQTGTYTLTVRGNAPDRFGLYSFRLLEAPARIYLPLVMR